MLSRRALLEHIRWRVRELRRTIESLEENDSLMRALLFEENTLERKLRALSERAPLYIIRGGRAGE